MAPVIKFPSRRSAPSGDGLSEQGSKTAKFEALCARFQPDVFRYAYWLAKNRALAEDIAQETFLRAWRAIDSLLEPESVRPWLLKIARREHARLYERKRFETIDIEDPVAVSDEGMSVFPSEDLSEVRAALFTLSDDYREPLVLQVLFGLTTSEIAEQLGIEQGAVLTRLCRAREKLRVVLSGEK